MSQKHVKTTPHMIDTAKLSATLNNSLVIRLVVACVVFAVSLILTMPKFLSILLLVLTAVLAGYDIILHAVDAVENGNFLATPVLVILITVLSFCIGFGIEGTALVLLYQIGILLLNFAKDHTKKAALDMLQGQDEDIVKHMGELVDNEENTVMAIENVMRTSAGSILRLAMLFAVIYAIALPLILNYFMSAMQMICFVAYSEGIKFIAYTPLPYSDLSVFTGTPLDRFIQGGGTGISGITTGALAKEILGGTVSGSDFSLVTGIIWMSAITAVFAVLSFGIFKKQQIKS